MYNFDEFMRRVKNCNPQFKRFKMTSDLDPLMKVLNSNGQKWNFAPAGIAQVQKAVQELKTPAITKYKNALLYLSQELKVSPGAIPAKPKMKYTKFYSFLGTYDGVNGSGQRKSFPPCKTAFGHEHVFTYESSNGDLGALTSVGTREHVKHRTHPGSAPFNEIQGKGEAEFTQGATTNSGANIGKCTDVHSIKLPWFICRYPRQVGSVIAEQWYQYTCDGIHWQNIPGAAYLLEKGVRTGGPSGFLLFFKKSNWQEHNKEPFHFEVEYVLIDPPEYVPKEFTDIKKSYPDEDDINLYAHRIVAGGN